MLEASFNNADDIVSDSCMVPHERLQAASQCYLAGAYGCVFAVRLGSICERLVRKHAQESEVKVVHLGHKQWENSDLHEMASHFFNIAAQAMKLQCPRKAVLLWRSAGFLWSQMARITVEHLRYSQEAYLSAAEGTLTIASTVSRHIGCLGLASTCPGTEAPPFRHACTRMRKMDKL